MLWTRQLGQGYSAFIAWGDRIATQYQSLSGQCVICMDANTGQTLWEQRYEWAYDPACVYSGPRATPTYADGRIYFARPAGLIGCLNADTGNLLWSVKQPAFFCRKGDVNPQGKLAVDHSSSGGN